MHNAGNPRPASDRDAQDNAGFSQRDVSQLDHSLVTGVAWTAIMRWVSQAISWISTLYVARILTPGDYGLVAMASIPIGLARLVEDLGLDAIIVQDRSLTRIELFLTGLFLALSVPVSAYFNEPAVTALICALSLTFVIDSFQILPRALLQRDLQFRRLAWLYGLQALVGAAVAAACATGGLGYWSLVISTLSGNGFLAFAMCISRPYLPAWPQEPSRLARAFLSGWHMIVSRAGWYAYSNADSTLIGRFLGKDALGVFGFSMTFAILPLQEVTTQVSKVTPGIFSSIQTDRISLRRYFLMLTEAISYLTFPMSFGLALTADDLVLFALGDKWTAVILPLQILCLYVAMNTGQVLLAHVLMWTGRFRATMWLTLYCVAVLPLCFYLGLPYGIPGVAWGWVVGFPVSVIPAFILVFRILDITWRTYGETLRPALLACLIMSSLVLLLRQVLPETWPHASRLAFQVGLGALTYCAVMLTLFRSRVASLYRIILESR
jgi:PST family polysaccharide transporter